MAKTVCIHSFRGGAGKSNVTANLAAMLAARPLRVGVVDTDLPSPGIHALFGLDGEHAERTLNDYLWERCEIADAAIDVGATLNLGDGGGALLLVPASLKAEDIARVLREGYDVDRLSRGFRDLVAARELDLLLIDTHPGLDEETLLSIAVADEVLVLLRPDRQHFQGTAVTLDVARRLEAPDLALVVNMVPDGYDRDDLRAEVERIYETPTAGLLPLSDDMARLGSEGLFVLRHPDHPVTAALRGVAERIAGGG